MKKPTNEMDVATKKNVILPKNAGIEKLKKINFKASKDLSFADLEIRITVKGHGVVAKFYNKGVLEAKQVVIIKPKPSPPPVDHEIINALKQLQFNLIVKK
ncbi:hypothetical protein [Pedobacter sp. UYP30]|uniref:hypothetical protein n=1 Tax=Pedobacter sp. UYP30 TaxID=1756400 RepID=UPI003391B4E3